MNWHRHSDGSFYLTQGPAFPEGQVFAHVHEVTLGVWNWSATPRMFDYGGWYAPIGFNLLPTKFTLKELQRLYEVILMRGIDKGNFRKRILAMGVLAEAGVQS
jgi:hypothetical protein